MSELKLSVLNVWENMFNCSYDHQNDKPKKVFDGKYIQFAMQ